MFVTRSIIVSKFRNSKVTAQALENCTGTGIAGSPRGSRETRRYGDKVHGLTAGMGPITRVTAGMGSTTCGDTAGTVCVYRGRLKMQDYAGKDCVWNTVHCLLLLSPAARTE